MSNTTSMTRMKMPTWLTLVWVGVTGSVLAWAWMWSASRGPSVVPLVVAIVGAVVVFRAARGNRTAVLALVLIGVTLMLMSIFWLVLIIGLSAFDGPVMERLLMAVLPVLTAFVLTAGAAAGLRATPRA